jgi:hypothetical protein
VTSDQEKCLFKVTKRESCVTEPGFLVRKNWLFDDQIKRSVTHSEHFFRSIVLALVLMAFNASQRFLAALLL